MAADHGHVADQPPVAVRRAARRPAQRRRVRRRGQLAAGARRVLVRPPAVGGADHAGRAGARRARAHRRPRVRAARPDEGPDRRRRAAVPGPDVAAAGPARRRVLGVLAQQPQLAPDDRGAPGVAPVPRRTGASGRGRRSDRRVDDRAGARTRCSSGACTRSSPGWPCSASPLVAHDRRRRRPHRLGAAGGRRPLAGVDDGDPHAVADARRQDDERPRRPAGHGAAAVDRDRRAGVAAAVAAARRVPRRHRHVRAVHRPAQGRSSTGPGRRGPMVVTDSPSFPSGHAIASAVTAIGLVVVLVPACAAGAPAGRSSPRCSPR